MTISIIIPVYNVEAYLAECVQSVVDQTYRLLQIILVDDGSTDQSGSLCDRWAMKDERITVIHQPNGGLSAARNTGIAHATGEYVVFLDSDDFFDDPDAMAKLVQRAETTSADVLHYCYTKYMDSTKEKTPYFKQVNAMPCLNSKSEQVKYLMSNGLYIASACNKMVRRSLLTEDLLFRNGVYSEDIEWCAGLMTVADRMDFVPYSFYCYRMREGSISHTIKDKKVKDLCDNVLRCVALLENASDDVRESLAEYTAFQYATFFAVQALAENKQTTNIERMKLYRNILKHHGNNRKVKALYWVSRFAGFRNTCRLMRLLYRKRS